MKPVRLYLDEAIQRGIVKNDAELSRRLDISRATVSKWRSGDRAPDDDEAVALAQLLGKPDGELLAECAAARAKNPTTRAAWERLARVASMTMCFTAVIGVALLAAPSPANAAPALKMQASMCIMLTSKRPRAPLVRSRRSAGFDQPHIPW